MRRLQFVMPFCFSCCCRCSYRCCFLCHCHFCCLFGWGYLSYLVWLGEYYVRIVEVLHSTLHVAEIGLSHVSKLASQYQKYRRQRRQQQKQFLMLFSRCHFAAAISPLLLPLSLPLPLPLALALRLPLPLFFMPFCFSCRCRCSCLCCFLCHCHFCFLCGWGYLSYLVWLGKYYVRIVAVWYSTLHVAEIGLYHLSKLDS